MIPCCAACRKRWGREGRPPEDCPDPTCPQYVGRAQERQQHREAIKEADRQFFEGLKGEPQ